MSSSTVSTLSLGNGRCCQCLMGRLHSKYHSVITKILCVCVWKLKAREVFMGATFQIKYWYQVFVEKALNNNGQIQCCYIEIGM